MIAWDHNERRRGVDIAKVISGPTACPVNVSTLNNKAILNPLFLVSALRYEICEVKHV